MIGLCFNHTDKVLNSVPVYPSAMGDAGREDEEIPGLYIELRNHAT